MGLLLDTSVLLAFGHRRFDLGRTLAAYGDLEVGIAAVTAAELTQGVALASDAARPARRAFVDEVLGCVPVLPFGAAEAREYARLLVSPGSRGPQVSAHRLLVAATALSVGWALLTLTPSDYDGMDGLVLAPHR